MASGALSFSDNIKFPRYETSFLTVELGLASIFSQEAINWLKMLCQRKRLVPKDVTQSFEKMNNSPQLLIDISVIYQRDARTGIQRVVRGILLQIMNHGAPGYVVRPVFATRKHGYHYAHPDFLSDGSATAAWRAQPGPPVHCAAGDIFLGLDLSAHLLPRHRRQVGKWKAAGTSICVLVHDLLPITHGYWFHRKTVRNFRRWLNFLVVFCDTAICVSAQTERQLRFWIAQKHPRQASSLRTKKIRLGGDIRTTAPSSGLNLDATNYLSRADNRPYILIVGTVEPRKAHDAALSAFESLWAREGDLAPNLVMVGKPGWKTDRLQARIRAHPEISGRLTWFENASDELLDQLYQGCRGVMVPSYAEGFGLPVEEARGYGKPVLARNLPVFREVGRQAISFFLDDASLPTALACWIKAIPDQLSAPDNSDPLGWDMTCADLFNALKIEIPETITCANIPISGLAAA